MASRLTLRLNENLDTPEKKKTYNEQLFTEVAPKYDFITRALSLGSDAGWKNRLVAALPDGNAPYCVDLACGTGDVTFRLAKRFPNGTILGLDLTDAMLRIAERRRTCPNVSFQRRDMCSTGLPNDSVDVVTGSYALRNAPTLDRALDEIQRILKPGGVAAFLDFSKPSAKPWQVLEHWILKAWGSFWGILLHGNHEVYAYIAESLKRFPDRSRLYRVLSDRRFEIVDSHRLYLGMLELLVVKKSN